ncbi:MAG: periplasmic heavy metal sensor [Candidatus Methylomirabilales bacterium]
MLGNTLTKVGIVAVLLLGLALPHSGLANRDRLGGPGGYHRGGPQFLFEKHAERLGLDGKTLEQIRAISEAAKGQSSELHTKFREAKTTMRKLLSAETPDKTAVMKQAEIMGAIKTDLRKHKLATILEIRALLTPEQRQELIKMRKERRSGRRHWGPRGPRTMDLDSRMSKLADRLSLTGRQQAEIRSILEQKMQKIQTMREEKRKLRQETESKIQGLLTDEQRAQFNQLREEQRERKRGHEARRGGG